MGKVKDIQNKWRSGKIVRVYVERLELEIIYEGYNPNGIMGRIIHRTLKEKHEILKKLIQKAEREERYFLYFDIIEHDILVDYEILFPYRQVITRN